MSDYLERIANDWREAGIHAEIPAELFTSITDGAKGWEKRVVKNLAFHSQLFNPDGSVRTWEEIVSTWKYDISTYGHKHFCEACGKNPILENCHLENQETGERIIVGNLCVIRYLDIVVDGIQLNEEEKREFLTGKMTEARKEHYREKFMDKCPTVWDDLKRYEDLLNNQDPSLLKGMVRRMRTHGFPGKVMETRWLEFLSSAELKKELFERDNAQRRKKEENIRRQMTQRAALRSKIMKEKREERKKIASDLDQWMADEDFFCTPVERDRLTDLVQRMKMGGIPNPADDRLRITIQERLDRIRSGPIDGEDPKITWLRDLDPEPLTNAERTFRLVCIGKPALDQGDKSMINRMKIRYG